MLTGDCLCGGVKYQIEGKLSQALNCHCAMCRKAQGSAFRSRARASPPPISNSSRVRSWCDILSLPPAIIAAFAAFAVPLFTANLTHIQRYLDYPWAA